MHTPGPWKVDYKGYRPDITNGGEFVPIHAEHRWIADVREPSANAHLIASAPDLLEALEAITDRFEEALCATHATRTDRQEIKEARAAIAKARSNG